MDLCSSLLASTGCSPGRSAGGGVAGVLITRRWLESGAGSVPRWIGRAWVLGWAGGRARSWRGRGGARATSEGEKTRRPPRLRILVSGVTDVTDPESGQFLSLRHTTVFAQFFKPPHHNKQLALGVNKDHCAFLGCAELPLSVPSRILSARNRQTNQAASMPACQHACNKLYSSQKKVYL